MYNIDRLKGNLRGAITRDVFFMNSNVTDGQIVGSDEKFQIPSKKIFLR